MKIIKLSANKGSLPVRLASIPDPPKELYYIGDSLVDLLDQPCIAVVGSRKVSPYGQNITQKLVQEVSRQGVVIISGLALGVDAVAHRATLNAGGKAIAVMPCGLDRIYPATNTRLAKEILGRGGALVSEYPIGTAPRRENFIQRNRLVSGLAQALLVTEAAEKSGTLHTANFALEQGREVLAVPGNINSPLSVGTNNLLKAGATPITESRDIFNALGWEVKEQHQQELFAANEDELKILKLLSAGTTEGKDLLGKSGLSLTAYNQTLTMLEITGKIKSMGGDQWSLN